MPRLVTVNIITNNTVAGNIFVLLNVLVRDFSIEDIIQMCRKFCFSAHHFYHVTNILRNIKAIVKGVTLNEALAVGIHRIKIFLETAIGKSGLHKPCSWIVNIFIIGRALQVFFFCGCLVGCLGNLRNTPVIISVFQSFRNRGTAFIFRNIMVGDIIFNTVVILQCR